MKSPLIICVVDDDEIYKYAASMALKDHHLAKKVLTFSDGEEALIFLVENIDNKDEVPDVIFLDINMPIMDGFQFMEEYVKLKPRVGKKIIIYMVTSSMDPQDINRAKEISDISDYLIKPINRDKMQELIDTIEY